MTRYIIFIFSIFGLMFISCGNDKTTAKEGSKTPEDKTQLKITSAQFEMLNLELGTPEQVTFSDEFQVNGMIDVPPENRATVSSYFDGYVSETHLLVGDEVNKGEVLVTLKHPDFIEFQQNYVEALSQFDYLQSEFQRKQGLFKEQIIAEKVFQATKNDFLKANAQLKAATEKIRMMNLNPKRVGEGDFVSEINILSPIRGKISKLNVAQGKFLAQSDMIMEILDVDHVHLELNVFEKDLLNIKVGDTLNFKIPEMSNQSFKAYVKLIGAEITENRSVRIHAHPLVENENFAVGMFVNAFFEANSQKYFALPETAFTEVDGETFLLQFINQTDETYTFKKIEVQTSSPQNGLQPILNSKQVNTQAKYLTKGVFDLIPAGGGG